jgi:hypothetical protein
MSTVYNRGKNACSQAIAFKLNRVKELSNLILENGAYSDSNYQRQMTKKGKNYNELEKTIVLATYKYKKFYGEKLQEELIELLITDKELLEHLKATDMETYEIVMEMRKYAEQHQ